ncbi:Gfo/Idh/MocA family protein [uncultured Clostridium sp.]|uniref:Gfo/Idh/MocA family protein n=1 Tax=uncultured Clostridium sp. TaxID=59620 RepID=UPI0025960631|nr:Gfo/Idh/MocA family oxidoreductase [uncultured Clostridium sp.]
MVNKEVNLAIVGLGGMGEWHRNLIDEIEGLRVCGSYDIREERQEYAREKGIKSYDSFDELLKDDNIDIVLCAVPNDLHKEISIRALESGKSVVCEKPATITSKDFEEMIKVESRSKGKLVIHQNRRWDEDFLTVKNIYENNIIGNIFKIESRVHGSRGIPGDWRQEVEHGGGMILDWGVHLIDQATMMIDEKIKSIYATVTNITNEVVEDGFTVELTFESGLIFVVEVGTNNFIELPRWYVLGEEGTVVINDWKLNGKVVHITDWSKNDAKPVKTASGLTKTMAPRTNETIKEEELPIVNSDIKDFYKNVMESIKGNEEVIVKNKEVLRVMRIMELIFESVRLKQVIHLENGI